jgi:ADP-heptose:LPS heptosyltransferase
MGTEVHLIPPRPNPDENLHVATYIIQQLKAAGPLAAVDLSEDHFASRDPDHGLKASTVLLHPGSGSKKKNWPLPNFLKLAEILKAKGQRPEFILGPAEADLQRALIQTASDEIKLHIVSDLKRVLKLVNQAGAIIGNDSGISHLAAFTGIPTVAIFGPSDPRIWKPIGRAVAVVRADIDCAPCLADDQKGCPDQDCLKAVTAEMVAAALARLLSDCSRNRTSPSGHI